jgi:hypothetical protein
MIDFARRVSTAAPCKNQRTLAPPAGAVQDLSTSAKAEPPARVTSLEQAWASAR